MYCICQHPDCDQRVINFRNKEERRKHRTHVVHHIEDVKESFENGEKYEELRIPTRKIVQKATDIFKRFFCAQVDNWANDLNFKDDSSEIQNTYEQIMDLKGE
jgi:hypothetical protein